VAWAIFKVEVFTTMLIVPAPLDVETFLNPHGMVFRISYQFKPLLPTRIGKWMTLVTVKAFLQ